MERRKTVSLAMIIKNEEDMLEECLNSVKDIVDEIILVDTGSVDRTLEIAKKYTNKVFNYKWENDFSKARNYSMKMCTKDWILFMDADDCFDEKDKERFIKLINNSNKEGHFFITKSYLSFNNKDDYSLNLNIRLILNKGRYEFKGAIHEQIVEKRSKSLDISLFSAEKIYINHKGYIKEVANKKEKRKRNLNILEKEFNKNPKDAFVNFNLGTEYYVEEEYEKALFYFKRSLENIEGIKGYTNKLFYKTIFANIELKKYEEALELSKEALKIIPKFTEVYFLQGIIYERQRRYTLAIDSYKRALELGEPQSEVAIINGCGSFRANKSLANIYKNFGDYKKAYEYFYKAALGGSSKLNNYYNFLECALKDSESLETFYKIINYNEEKNILEKIIITKVFIDNGLYDEGEKILENKDMLESVNYNFLMGKIAFYKNKFENAIKYFKKIEKNSTYYDESISLIVLSEEFIGKGADGELIESIESNGMREVLNLIIELNNGEVKREIKEKSEECLEVTMNILENILKSKQFDYFQKSLEILNYINSTKILSRLGILYDRNNYKPLAIKETIKSLCKYEYIDEEAYWIFLKSI